MTNKLTAHDAMASIEGLKELAKKERLNYSFSKTAKDGTVYYIVAKSEKVFKDTYIEGSEAYAYRTVGYYLVGGRIGSFVNNSEIKAILLVGNHTEEVKNNVKTLLTHLLRKGNFGFEWNPNERVEQNMDHCNCVHESSILKPFLTKYKGDCLILKKAGNTDEQYLMVQGTISVEVYKGYPPYTAAFKFVPHKSFLEMAGADISKYVAQEEEKDVAIAPILDSFKTGEENGYKPVVRRDDVQHRIGLCAKALSMVAITRYVDAVNEAGRAKDIILPELFL